MSAAKLRAVEPVAPVVDPLAAARERVAEIKRQIAEVDAAILRAESSTSPVETTATAAQGWRQKLKAIFAGQLEAGRLDTATPEIATITRELASAEDAERQAAAIGEARRTVIADYHAKKADLRGQLASAQRELDGLLFAGAGADIRSRLIPAFMAAFHQFAAAKAALDGAGVEHHVMRQYILDRHGIAVQALGTPTPEKLLVAHPVGFDLATDGAYNTVRVDCSAATAAGRVDFKGRWSA